MQNSSPNARSDLRETTERRVAVVTGAADGIGWATTQRLAEEFAHIVLIDMREDAVRERARELGSDHLGLRADVASEGDVVQAMQAVAERFGRMEALVNNAGISEQAAPTLEQDYVGSCVMWGMLLVCDRPSTHVMFRENALRLPLL